MVFERVHTDLESQGYKTQTFIIPAAGVGAPHRRDRVWIVGYSKHNGSPSATQSRSTSTTGNNHTQGKDTTRKSQGAGRSNDSEVMENSRRTIRGQQSSRNKESIGSGTSQKTERAFDRDSITGSSEREMIMADSSSIQSDGRGRSNDSIKAQGQKQATGPSGSVANTNSERGRLRNTQRQNAKDVRKSSQGQRHGWWDIEPNVGRVADGVQGRILRLKGLGNSIIPQIAEEIGKAIMKVELDSD